MQSVPKISKFDRHNDHLIIRLWIKSCTTTIHMKGSESIFLWYCLLFFGMSFRLTCETVARMKSLSLTNCLKGAEQNFPVPPLSYTVQDSSAF